MPTTPSDGPGPELRTDRLLLRRWRVSDRPAFAALNADARVMEHFPAPLSAADSDALAARADGAFDTHGFGLWAVEVRGGPAFIGFVGLAVPTFEAPFTPCVEIGWRLAADHHGRGFATEAARAALVYGFDVVGLDAIVSFTTVRNAPSRRVMEKIGLRHDPARDFDHPRTPGWHGQRHVFYRLTAERWRANGG